MFLECVPLRLSAVAGLRVATALAKARKPNLKLDWQNERIDKRSKVGCFLPLILSLRPRIVQNAGMSLILARRSIGYSNPAVSIHLEVWIKAIHLFLLILLSDLSLASSRRVMLERN